MDWEIQLIMLYEFICKYSREQGWAYCQRFRSFADLTFTDAEVICIYLGGVLDKRREGKDLYEYTQRHLPAWWPQVPSEGGYLPRWHRVAEVFGPLLEVLQSACPRLSVLEQSR